ncbi:uncharacterized protein LOC120348272 isoform X6 [Styela clava]
MDIESDMDWTPVQAKKKITIKLYATSQKGKKSDKSMENFSDNILEETGKKSDKSMEGFSENFLQEIGHLNDPVQEDSHENIFRVTETESDSSLESSPDLLHLRPCEHRKRERKKIRESITQKGQMQKKKKPKRPCVYCEQFQSKLSRHIARMHSEEPEVKEILGLPPKQRNRRFDQLRKNGMYKYNLKMLKENRHNQFLQCERSVKSDDLKMCGYCKAFVTRKYFHMHARTCRSQNGEIFCSKLPLSVLTAENTEDLLFTDLLARFNNDEPGRLCRTDHMIKKIGRSLFERHKRKQDKKTEVRKSVMLKMRTLATLFMEFRRCMKSKFGNDVKTESMLDRKNFLMLEEAINNVTTLKEGGIKAGSKIFIGNLLKNAVKIMKGTYLIEDDDAKAETIDKFAAVLNLRWTSMFGDAEYILQHNRQTKLRQPELLPNEQDVAKIKTYTVNTLASRLSDEYFLPCQENFIVIRNLVMSRLTLFNARRGGEPSRLLMKDWENAKNDKWIDTQRIQFLSSSVDQELMKKFKVMYQGGKGNNHLVPVLVPIDCVAGLDFLVNLDIRKNSDVHKENRFIFASTRLSMEHASGWHATKEVVDAAGVKAVVTATKMRHRASTLYACLDIPEQQQQVFFRHMGHSSDINKNVYQCPLAIEEITQVGKYFADIDGMSLSSGRQDSMACSASTEKEACSKSTENEACSESTEKEACSESTEKEVANTNYLAGSDNISGVAKQTKLVNEFIDEGRTETGQTVKFVRKGSLLITILLNSVDANRIKLVYLFIARQYVKWQPQESELLKNNFKDVIEDTSQEGNKGNLPSLAQIKLFLEENHILESITDMNQRVRIVHTKLFNERKKFREKYQTRLERFN